MTSMSTLSTMNEAVGNAENQHLSKSQKKRMKRKAAASKQTGSSQDDSSVRTSNAVSIINSAATTGGDPLNPQATLRNILVDRGYNGQDVDSAIDEMWNLGLPYDELDSVLSFVESKKRGPCVLTQIDDVVASSSGACCDKSSGGEDLKNKKGDEETSNITNIPTINRTTHTRSNEPEGSSGKGNAKNPAFSVRKGPIDTDSASTDPTLVASFSSDASSGTQYQPQNGKAAPNALGKFAAANLLPLQSGDDSSKEEFADRCNGSSGIASNNVNGIKARKRSAPAGGGAPSAPAATALTIAADVVSRLDLVANYDNIHDAVHAIAEWATKSAKVSELSILCTESSIIPTIIRRSILECIDDASEFNSVLSPLLCLLSTLLRPQPPKAASEHVRAILNSARKAASLCQPSLSVRSDASNRNVPVQNGKDTRGVKTPTTRVSKTSLNVGIAEEVSTAVMNLVYMNILFSGEDSILSGNQLASVNMHTTSQASDDCSAVNGRNRHYASSAGNAVLATLMSQRDKQRSAAEKSGVAATLAIRSSRGMNGDLGISSANRAKLPVIEHARLFGESSTVKIGHSGGSEIGKLFAENQVAYNSIEAHLADTNSLYEEGCGKLSKDLELCALMKCDLTAKKEELLRQLKQVEGEEVKLKAKAEGLHAQLENEATEQAKNLTVLQAQLEERKEIMQVASACKTVEGAFGIFQSTLFDIDAVTESKQDKSVESFLSIVRNYLATEVECMQLLQERSSTLRSKMPQLELEMVQCRNLGMTTNVAQMNHALMDMTKNVGEDDVAVNSMQKEAKQMQEVVTVVIKDMTMLGQAASHNLKMCRDIMSSFRHMGINCDSFAHLVQDKSAVLEGSLDKKQAFTPDCDPTALTGFVKTEPMVTEQLESNILAMDGTCGQSSADYPTLTGISAAAMPKLSWAAGRSLPPPAGKKSFLDIQKEEMNTKGNL